MSNTINMYLDESCHTQFDGTNTMSLVTVYTMKNNNRLITKAINILKRRYNATGELKWNKVGKSNINLYKDIFTLMAGLVKDDNLRIRTILVDADKSLITGDYNDWYYKMSYILFDKVIGDDYLNIHNITNFNLFLDKKDRLSHKKTSTTATYLERSMRGRKKVNGMAVNSEDFALIQIADIIAGAMTYKMRGLSTSSYKLDLINHIEEQFNINLNRGTYRKKVDFNIYIWRLPD